MKRLVVLAGVLAWVLAGLVACQNTRDVPQPAPPPSAPAAPAPAPGRAVTAAPAVPTTLGGVAPVSADFTIKDFAFTSGEKLPELRIHYMTLGTPKRNAAGHVTNAVIVLHGTTGSGQQFTRTQFADELFGPGQPLDLTRTYVILPDDIGHGASSKPSDGMHARFPHYGYRDMVLAEHALVVDGLHVDHLRLVMGTSMGCMHAWMWAERWPDAMDAAMPLACLPTQIAGRNREWRKMVTDAIKQDPAWHGGEYTEQPRGAMLEAGHFLLLAGSAPLADQNRLATRDAADQAVDKAEGEFLAGHDANDVLYAIDSSRDYDPSGELEKITARVLFVNSADDFINPPELGIAEQMIKRVKRGRFVLIPASEQTHGHGTHTWARFWKQDLQQLLDATAKP